jgi:hypothetical protein
MSEVLIGVVIGGVLAGFGTWVTIAVQQWDTVREMRIERLYARRDRLEAVYERTMKALVVGMREGNNSTNQLSDVDFLLPDEVSKALEALLDDKDKEHAKTHQNHYYSVSRAMKKSLRDIENQVDEVIQGKKHARHR